jgi:hypothetical protein
VTIWVIHNHITFRFIYADEPSNLHLFDDTIATFKFGDCSFYQVQCIRAPCDPQLMCPAPTFSPVATPTPTPTVTPTITPTSVMVINGQVVTGPSCPVIRPEDPNCADRPYQGDFIVRSTITKNEILRFSTDKNGNFHITLSPGTYVVDPVKPIGIGHQVQSLEVKPGGPMTVTLHYDTGIR